MTQVTVPMKVWTKVTDSSAKLHIKIPNFTKVYYLIQSENPSSNVPNPKDDDLVKVLIIPTQGRGFLDLEYSEDDPLWLYSTGCPLYVIVE